MNGFFKKNLIVFYSLYVYLLAISLLLLLAPFVFIISFFGGIKGDNLIYKSCHFYAKSWFFLSGIRYKEINAGKQLAKKTNIFIANHNSYLDVLCLLNAINQPVRALGKEEMAKYPIFGYFYKKAVVSINRESITMRAQSIVVLKKIIAQNISIFIFPEGTFNETQKPLKSFYDGAFIIAIDTQTPIQPILFLDNNKRMNNKGSFNLTPGKCRVLFLDEIPVAGLTRNNLQQLKKEVYNAMESGLIDNGFTN